MRVTYVTDDGEEKENKEKHEGVPIRLLPQKGMPSHHTFATEHNTPKHITANKQRHQRTQRRIKTTV